MSRETEQQTDRISSITMANTSSPSMSSLQGGLDNLWRYQLRKENAALLAAHEKQQKLVEVLAAENAKVKKDIAERFSTLETRMINLEDDERKDRHAFETFGEEMASLKAEMGIVVGNLERRNAQDQDTGHTTNNQAPRTSTLGSVLPLHPADRATVFEASSKQANSGSVPKAKVAGLTRGAVVSVLRTPRLEANPSESSGAVTRSRSQSRSRTTSQEAEPTPLPNNHAPPPPYTLRYKATATSVPAILPAPAAPAQIPRLDQNHSSLKKYLERSNRMWLSLPQPQDQKFEINFVAQFIQGINNENQRKRLVNELLQRHQSRTNKDGKMEILCKWKAVEQGMQIAGLLDTSARAPRAAAKTTAEKKERARKKNRVVAVPSMLKELIGTDGFHGT